MKNFSNTSSTKTNTENNNDVLEDYGFFQSTIYKIHKPEFHNTLSAIAEEAMCSAKEITNNNGSVSNYNNSPPLCNMSTNMLENEQVHEFADYILSTAYNILDSQGYDLTGHNVGISSIWMQEHHRYSDMPEHVHGEQTQLVGFYFLEVNDHGCQLGIHDPRPAKVITNLPLKNATDITHGNNVIFIKPAAGDLIFTNAYLPHSFTRNDSDDAIKFLHINISAHQVLYSSNNNANLNENCKINTGPEII